ncbi:MAG: hypothetical protein QW838_02940 [Candidatus Nitrosotenuis sp.]
MNLDDLLREAEDTIFLRLEEGTHQLRICPPFDGHHITVKQAGHYLFGRYYMCLNDLFKREKTDALLMRTVEGGILSKEDFADWKKLGCPACKLDEKDGKGRTNIRCLWNTVHRDRGNKVYVWSTSLRRAKTIANTYSFFKEKFGVNIFDVEAGFDLLISVSGRGIFKRYGDIQFIQRAVPLGVPVDALHNLFDLAIRSIIPFSELQQLAKETTLK